MSTASSPKVCNDGSTAAGEVICTLAQRQAYRTGKERPADAITGCLHMADFVVKVGLEPGMAASRLF